MYTRRRDCKKTQHRKTIPQSPTVTAPFTQGSLSFVANNEKARGFCPREKWIQFLGFCEVNVVAKIRNIVQDGVCAFQQFIFAVKLPHILKR